MNLSFNIIAFAAAALYLASGMLMLLKKERLSGHLAAFALALNLFLVARNAVINGYVPFVSMYQVLTFLGAAFAAVYLYVCIYLGRKELGHLFPFMQGIILTGVGCMGSGDVWHFPPALDSVFFVPHVLAYMIAYCLGSLSFAICISGLIMKKDRSDDIRLTARLALPFMLSGLSLGAIWANEVWGAFWSWDVKECFSLITLLIYSALLHAAKTKGMKRLVVPLCILGFAGILATLFLANVIPSESMHTYSQ